MNTPPPPFTSTPFSHQPDPPNRRVTFSQSGTTAQSRNPPTGMPAGGKKQEIPIMIYAGELSRLLGSGMSYEAEAAEQIVKKSYE